MTRFAAPAPGSEQARILWLTHLYPRSSFDLQGLFLHRLAKELPGRGFRIRVVAPGAPHAPEQEMLDGIEVRRFRYPGLDRGSLAYTGEMHRGAIREPMRFLGFVQAICRAAERAIADFDPHLVHCHWWFPAGFALRASSVRHVDYWVSLHGTDIRLLSRSLLPWPLARWVIHGARRVLPVSESLKREIVRLRLAPRSCMVLPMPADDTVFTPQPLNETAPPAFVIPARLVAQKRIDVAIRALGWARDQGTSATLHVVGEGEKRAELIALARHLGLSDRVVFHGFVPQLRLAELFRESRAVLLTSQNEGYGLVLVEAALCGRPVIGVRSGAITDFVSDESTGLLVEPGDYEALGRALLRLAANSRDAERLAAGARLRALARTAKPLADQLASAYRESVGRVAG